VVGTNEKFTSLNIKIDKYEVHRTSLQYSNNTDKDEAKNKPTVKIKPDD